MAQPQQGHEIVVTMTVELIGVTLIALIAGISEPMGKLMVTFMAGLALIWLITHTTELQKVMGKV